MGSRFVSEEAYRAMAHPLPWTFGSNFAWSLIRAESPCALPLQAARPRRSGAFSGLASQSAKLTD